MESKRHNGRRKSSWRIAAIGAVIFSLSAAVAQGNGDGMMPEWRIDGEAISNADTVILMSIDDLDIDASGHDYSPPRFIHRIGAEWRMGQIIATHPFLEGSNFKMQPIKISHSAHLQYSFRSIKGNYSDKIYGGAYQGIGLAYYVFGNREELGNPLALYIFQGARIARISRRISLNYEWNFGLSDGWVPYDYITNYYNVLMGTRINAYLNANFYFNWAISPQVEVKAGASFTHFSNGNTKIPNIGLNTIGLTLGLVYNFDKEDPDTARHLQIPISIIFHRHMSYDLVLFGSSRRTGVAYSNKMVPSPHNYTVLGFNLSSMYNLGYKLRLGGSLDGVYDESANITAIGNNFEHPEDFIKPPLGRQLALGISARVEYVMPYFTVGFGLGMNVLHRGGDMKSFYQILALKIAVTRSSFIHVGYRLKNFETPDFLMIGLGYRFNNKSQRYRH